MRTERYTDAVPNPAKVVIILEELGLPYQSKWLELEELKQPTFESVNPNGRVPGITTRTQDFLPPLACN